jgi:hypothetical protein
MCSINTAAGTVHLGCVVPALSARGNYNIAGRVFELPVEGNGPFIALLGTNIVYEIQK